MRLHGILIAPAARDWLAAAPQAAVHSLYRNSVNLVDGRDALLSLVLQDSGPGPFALVVRPEASDFRAAGGFETQLSLESRVEVGPAQLTVGTLQVELAAAAHWKPRPSWEQVGPERVRQQLGHLRELLRRHAPEGSFAPLVDPAAAGAGSSIGAAALAAAAEPARRLMEGLHRRDPEAAAEAAEGLAGLGGGVTPAGDDYLLGALHALWALAEPADANALAQAIVGQAVPRTNLISAAWLRAATRGEAGNEWHVLAVALASGGELGEAAEWLIRRGHTSGADALAGFLAAAEALLDN